MKNTLTIHSLKARARRIEAFLNTYKALLLFLVLASLYGFIALRINYLSSAPPSQADIDSAQHATTPKKLSQSTIERLQSLQDTSQRTQALFNEARQNPFNE